VSVTLTDFEVQIAASGETPNQMRRKIGDQAGHEEHQKISAH